MMSDRIDMALEDHPPWIFVWTGGRPYTTTIAGWTRQWVIREVGKNLSQPWKKTYRQGGRVVRIKMMRTRA